ncbi:MAG: hypothetical protein K2X91_05005, partial [Thermoleophilia bacterium]|nr:hypothetical protein [Thermoleophilia bacterium]
MAAFPQRDAVAWFSAKDGSLQYVAAGLPRLAGVAVAPDGTVLAISRGAVVALSREAKTPRVVIAAESLQSPWRLAVSPRDGDILVAENSDRAEGGTPHHQVKRFSADGRLLSSLGRPGGRADGVYVPTDFRGLTDIEADHEGGFVVTEGDHTPPRRTARFDARGTLVREWLGAQHYGVIACPEPGNPRFAWTRANADRPGLLRWEVDVEAKTSRLVETYQESFAGNRYFRGNAAHGSLVPTAFRHKGRLYLSNGSMSSLTLYVYDPVARRVRPSNASSGPDGRAVIWNDLDDDGQVVEDEVRPIARNIVGGYIDPDDLSVRTTPYGTRER